jgi:group II intron reverse transcriptase/maturase
MKNNKPFQIERSEVMAAYRKVKAKGGAEGIDGVSIEEFEKDLKKNLYIIWSRMSSGTYFPPPVKAVEIPKKQGGVRRLGIPTVADRVAQAVVRERIEAKVEPIFHEDSYGYRRGKSALDAVGKARERCWQYNYVLEFDIKGLFDNIDHKLLMKAVEKHVQERWVILYIRRWLIAPFETADGKTEERRAGTPQGGVVSPVLANLFMHYAFDMWMTREHKGNPFERYADDAVIHCYREEEAKELLKSLGQRMTEVGLELHPLKTRIVYCQDENRKEKYENTSFDFLGYTFSGKYVRGKRGMFVGFVAYAGKKVQKAFRDKIKDMNLQLRAGTDIEAIARTINPMVRGWLNYYCAYYPTSVAYTMKCLNKRIIIWALRKYKRFRRSKRKATEWVMEVIKREPKMFAHWAMGWVSY